MSIENALWGAPRIHGESKHDCGCYRWFPSVLKVIMVIRPETLVRRTSFNGEANNVSKNHNSAIIVR
jgi:hypothetical protein